MNQTSSGNGENTTVTTPAWKQRLFAPVDIASLVFFRILFGSILLWETGRYYFGGHVKAWWIDPTFHSTYPFFHWIEPWSGNGMYIHFAILAVAAFCVLVGLFYRVAMTVFCVGFTYVFLLDTAQYLNHFYLVCLMSFLAIFMPLNRQFSIDAWRQKSLRSQTIPGWCLWLVRFQIGIPYFYGGLAKFQQDWLRGEPMNLWLEPFHDSWVGPLLQHPVAPLFFSYGGLLLDLFIVPLLIWRKTRLWAFLVALGFHLTNSVLFDIGIFPWFMIVATSLFFEPDWPRRWLRKLFPKRVSPSPASKPIADFPMDTRQKALVWGLCIWAFIQLIVPFRHWLYPGNIIWTNEGYHFAWHMKLTTYQGFIRFLVTDAKGERIWPVESTDYLTPRQATAMPARPEMILQLAHHIAEDFKRKGHPDVRVRVQAEVSLNGRRPQWLIDPDVDLTEYPISIGHKDYFTELVVPLSQRIYEDQNLMERNTWQEFEVGSGILIIEVVMDDDQPARQIRRQAVMTARQGELPLVVDFRERDGKLQPSGEPHPVTLGKTPASLYMEATSTTPDTVTIGERPVACIREDYVFDDPVTQRRGRLSLWRADAVRVPYRNLEALGPPLALEADVIKADYEIELLDDNHSGRFTVQIASLDESVEIKGQRFPAVVELSEFSFNQNGQSIEARTRRWLSDKIPGHEARLERAVVVDGRAIRERMAVVDYNIIPSGAVGPHGQALQQIVETYYREMTQADESRRIAAINSMLPTKADLRVLFPSRADRLWDKIEPALQNLLNRSGDLAEGISRNGDVRDIQAIDMRKSDASGSSRQALDLIPEEVPAYLVVTRWEKVSTWTGPYLFVNGRWVRIPGFEEIPRLLSESQP